jgi:hypothetical protein
MNMVSEVGEITLLRRLNRRYIGITRADVKDLLSKNLVHQLAKQPLPSHNKGIYASDVNYIWYADLMDLNTYESKKPTLSLSFNRCGRLLKICDAGKTKNKRDERSSKSIRRTDFTTNDW